ncbi:hypothetical protein HDA40_007832 [Hamadaea flava]|uniref:DUF11 domain-containing protein n=1 Tax=Hamadaea flava TaxID=1742688 RepID=A0ABV8LW48_9ACTN|nr:hypothetical protein [Hamadaea flava]MCP2329325.1 hypothetical protein [Hamadaea flava]
MNVRQAITVVAAGALLGAGIGAAPAYADDVDLKAIPATASGKSGGDVTVTIAFEASAPISGTPPVVQLDVAFPAGVPIKVYPSPCKYWGTFKARCQLDSVTQGRHELTFQVVMLATPTSTGSSKLTIMAAGYTEPNHNNNTAPITLRVTASGSSSPSAARSATASAKATPKSSKRSGTPSAAPTEDGVLPTEAVGAVADGQTTTTVDAAAVAENEDSDSLPVLIFGGAGALVVVGGLLLWLVLRRRNDDEDEEDDDEYDRYRARY